MVRVIQVIAMLLLAHILHGQIPRVEKVERIISFPLSTIEVLGSGFSNNPAQLQVWFGHVKGTIISASEARLVVQVPPQARLGSVEVINLSSSRSGKSSGKFMTNFSGCEPFANSFSAVSYVNPDDIFDLCVCDFDGDGRPDIAGSKRSEGKVNLMLLMNQSTVSANNSTVAFTQSAIPLNFPTFSITCGDLNGDGRPEIVATRGGSITGSTVFIFPNTSSPGSVSFGSPVSLDLVTGDLAREVAIHDLNGDGRPEIIVANAAATNVMYVFENQLSSATISASGFTRHAISTGTATLAVDIADVTGDGWPDILTLPSENGTRVILLRNPGNGSLSFPAATNINIPGSGSLSDIATADFNNDGRLDIVLTDRSVAVNKAFVYLNAGNSIFTSVNGSTGFAAPIAWGVDVGDMNGDGFADFVVGSRDFANPQINIFINSGASTPTFSPTKIVNNKAVWFVRLGDLDGDAKPDIALTSTNNTAFSIDVIKNRNCHKPVILNPGPLTICSGQTITLEAIPMPGVTLSWSTGATGPTANITSANAGTITLTATGDGGQCTCTSTITVNAGTGTAPPKPVISGPDGVCAGSPLILTTGTVAGSPSYIWSGPNGFEATTSTNSVTISNTVTRDQLGSYTVVVKSGDCLSSRSDPKFIDVVEPEGFSITSSSGAGACTGQSIALSVNPVSGYTYQWKKGGTNMAGQTSPTLNLSSLTTANAGSYTVLVSHQTISCSSETSPFVLSVFTSPVASFTTTPSQICVGTEVTFNSAGSTVDPAATPSFVWNFGDQGSATGTTTTHTYLNPFSSVSASLTLSYSGISGCSNITTRSLVVSNAAQPLITTDPAVEEICNDGSESVALEVVGDFVSYLWNVQTGNTGSSVTVRSSGTYSVATLDNNGCTGNASIVLAAKAECAGTGPPPIDIFPYKVFTPNQDGKNDFWTIVGVGEYSDCTMSIFDGRGMRVFQLTGYPEGENAGWDGRMAGGSEVPDGTYYFVFSCPDGGRMTGSVLVVRK